MLGMLGMLGPMFSVSMGCCCRCCCSTALCPCIRHHKSDFPIMQVRSPMRLKAAPTQLADLQHSLSTLHMVQLGYEAQKSVSQPCITLCIGNCVKWKSLLPAPGQPGQPVGSGPAGAAFHRC